VIKKIFREMVYLHRIDPYDLATAAAKYAEHVKNEETKERFIKMPQNFLTELTWVRYIPVYREHCPKCHGKGIYEDKDSITPKTSIGGKAMAEQFLILFDKKTGERLITIPYNSDITPERAEELLAEGYELVSAENWNLLIGNIDGQEHVKDFEHGGYKVKPAYVPTLEEAKTTKITELKTTRDSMETEPVRYLDYLYDFDTKSFDRINAAIIALDQTRGTIGWTTADNSVVEVTADTLRGVIASAALRSDALHTIYRELKTQVNEATSNEEVEAISWPEE